MKSFFLIKARLELKAHLSSRSGTVLQTLRGVCPNFQLFFVTYSNSQYYCYILCSWKLNQPFLDQFRRHIVTDDRLTVSQGLPLSCGLLKIPVISSTKGRNNVLILRGVCSQRINAIFKRQ